MGAEQKGMLGLVALGYALIFWGLGWRYRWVPLALIFGLAPFQNDVSLLGGLHFSLSEVHLLLSLPLLAMGAWGRGWGWMGGALWGGLALTLALTLPNWRETSGISLVQMGLYWLGAVAVFANLARSPADFVPAWRLLMVSGCVLACMALWTRSNSFWGLNKNGVGASLACAWVVAVERWSCGARRRWIAALALALLGAGLIMVLSRGAWIAAGVGAVYLLAWRGEYLRLAQLVLAAVPVVFAVWGVLPEESRAYAVGLDESRYNIRARIVNAEWAREQWLSSPWIGVGAGLRKEYDATNVLWLCLAETGPAGLAAFLGVHARLFLGVWARRATARGTTPERASAVALAGALVLGKFAHGLVDHYWSRGAIMVAWASVGAALCASAETARARRYRGGFPDQDALRRHRMPGRGVPCALGGPSGNEDDRLGRGEAGVAN